MGAIAPTAHGALLHTARFPAIIVAPVTKLTMGVVGPGAWDLFFRNKAQRSELPSSGIETLIASCGLNSPKPNPGFTHLINRV
jgi:hypothetical protein